MSAFRTALLVLLMSSCVEPGGQPDSRGESGSGRKERMTALVPLVMADGGAARSARSEGLTTIPSQMASDAVVYWPGSEPLSGFQAIEYALSQAPWSGESRFYWQPLMLRNAPGLGLVAGVLTADGPVVNGGQLEIGRYLAVWQLDSATSQLKAFMAGQVALAPLDGQVAGPIAAASPLPGAIEAADAEFRSLLERDGPAIAFHQWFADNGMTFGGDGALSIGPDMVAAQLEDAGLFRTWNMSPTHRGSSADSALAWVGGDLTITGRNPDNGISESRWNYLMFWERQPNGEYRILAAMTNLKPRNQAGG